MPILAPCQPGNGPQFPIDPDFIMESSCVELVQGHESFQTYLTELKNQGTYVFIFHFYFIIF